MDRLLQVYIFAIVAVSSALGLYFHIGETERKCFIEEIPDETMVIGEYIHLYSADVCDKCVKLPNSTGLLTINTNTRTVTTELENNFKLRELKVNRRTYMHKHDKLTVCLHLSQMLDM